MITFDGEDKPVDEPGSSAVHSDRGHPLAGISNGRSVIGSPLAALTPSWKCSSFYSIFIL
jgi:hypothetical protein